MSANVLRPEGSLICLRNSSEAPVVQGDRIQRRVKGDEAGGQIMDSCVGDSKDLGFYSKWEGRLLKGIGSEYYQHPENLRFSSNT